MNEHVGHIYEFVEVFCSYSYDRYSFPKVAFLLTVDPTQRPSAAEAIGHPWLQDALSRRIGNPIDSGLVVGK